MANKKISELDSRASLSLSDLLAVGDPTTGYLYKITITDLKTLTGAGVISFNGRVGSVTPAEGDYNLNQLGDVIITSPTNNQVVRYNGSNWVNATLDLTTTLAALTDVSLTSIANGQLLKYNSTSAKWENFTPNYISLSSLSATAPLSYNSGTGVFAIGQAGVSTDGFLTTADWNTFNNKLSTSVAASTYVPYTGASTNVNLGTNTLLAAQIKATSSAGLSINANSGTQIADLGAGGGANMTLYGGLTGTTISLSSSATASSFIKTGGTSSQFLMADGSSNSNTYLQLSGGTLTGEVFFNVPIRIKHTTGLASPTSGYNSISADANGYFLASASLNFYAYLGLSTLTNNRTFTLPDASGTIALTSNLSSYVPTSRTLTINGTTYDLSADRSWTISTGISGSGVSGRIPFFDGTSSVTSDSNLSWDNTSKFISTAGVYVFNNTTNAYMLTSNGDNIGSVFNVSATRWGLGYGSSTSSLATAVLSWNNSGNVSIGNTNNTYKLDVTGTGRFTGTILAGAANGNIRLTGATTDGFIGVNTSTLYLTDWDTAAKGMVINLSTGKVGIGTTSPVGLLQLNGSIANSADASTFTIKQSSTSYNNGIYIERSGERTGYFMYISSTNDSLTFRRNWVGTQSDVMVLTREGNVGIGTTSPSTTLDVNGTINAGLSGGNIKLAGTVQGGLFTAGTNSLFLTDWNTGTKGLLINLSTGVITVSQLGSGTVTATSGVLSAVSDMNLKIEDGFIDNALEKVMNLKPRYFTWKEQSGLPTDLRQLGFYAQEVNAALGEEAANTPKNRNEKWGVYDRGLIAFLTKAIQEQQIQIEKLKNK